MSRVQSWLTLSIDLPAGNPSLQGLFEAAESAIATHEQPEPDKLCRTIPAWPYRWTSTPHTLRSTPTGT